MVPGLGNSYLEKIGIPEHGISGGESPARMAVDSSAIKIDPRKSLG